MGAWRSAYLCDGWVADGHFAELWRVAAVVGALCIDGADCPGAVHHAAALVLCVADTAQLAAVAQAIRIATDLKAAKKTAERKLQRFFYGVLNIA